MNIGPIILERSETWIRTSQIPFLVRVGLVIRLLVRLSVECLYLNEHGSDHVGQGSEPAGAGALLHALLVLVCVSAQAASHYLHQPLKLSFSLQRVVQFRGGPGEETYRGQLRNLKISKPKKMRFLVFYAIFSFFISHSLNFSIDPFSLRNENDFIDPIFVRLNTCI